MTNDEIERLRPLVGKFVTLKVYEGDQPTKAFLCGFRSNGRAAVEFNSSPLDCSSIDCKYIIGEWKEPRTIEYEIVLWSDGIPTGQRPNGKPYKIGDTLVSYGKVINIIKHTETIDENEDSI